MNVKNLNNLFMGFLFVIAGIYVTKTFTVGEPSYISNFITDDIKVYQHDFINFIIYKSTEYKRLTPQSNISNFIKNIIEEYKDPKSQPQQAFSEWIDVLIQIIYLVSMCFVIVFACKWTENLEELMNSWFTIFVHSLGWFCICCLPIIVWKIWGIIVRIWLRHCINITHMFGIIAFSIICMILILCKIFIILYVRKNISYEQKLAYATFFTFNLLLLLYSFILLSQSLP
jgi:hypothetical protein